MQSAVVESFDQLVTSTVERFLQSAVVVDDRAFLPGTIEPTALRTPTEQEMRLAEAELEEASDVKLTESPLIPPTRRSTPRRSSTHSQPAASFAPCSVRAPTRQKRCVASRRPSFAAAI